MFLQLDFYYKGNRVLRHSKDSVLSKNSLPLTPPLVLNKFRLQDATYLYQYSFHHWLCYDSGEETLFVGQ